jgi:hypothetical protein
MPLGDNCLKTAPDEEGMLQELQCLVKLQGALSWWSDVIRDRMGEARRGIVSVRFGQVWGRVRLMLTHTTAGVIVRP